MREIEIERLVQWAYRDELPKRGIGDVANMWTPMREYFELLTIVDDEPGFPVIMGMPHPDALTIERAVQGLRSELQLDWAEYRYVLMGDKAILAASIDDPFAPRSTARDAWRADLQNDRLSTVDRNIADHQATRRVFSEVGMVEQSARFGRRPVWDAGPLEGPRRILGRDGRVVLVGESKGSGRYTYGSHCPLQYRNLEQLVMARAEYLVWRGALDRLFGVLKAWTLTDWTPTKADAPTVPWLDQLEAPRPAPIAGVAAAWRTWPKGKRTRTSTR